MVQHDGCIDLHIEANQEGKVALALTGNLGGHSLQVLYEMAAKGAAALITVVLTASRQMHVVEGEADLFALARLTALRAQNEALLAADGHDNQWFLTSLIKSPPDPEQEHKTE